MNLKVCKMRNFFKKLGRVLIMIIEAMGDALISILLFLD